nr:hypothetical protein [uncultured Butyrivibrio sp.]
MKKNLYREKSIKKISSPENLDEYLRVTTPSMWAVLFGTAIVLIGIFIWSAAMSIGSYTYGTAKVENGKVTAVFQDNKTSRLIDSGMEMVIGDVRIPIDSIGIDADGNVIAVSMTYIPDGEYEVKTCYKQTRMIDMLLN